MSQQHARSASPTPPPFPMVYANGYALTRDGAPVPEGSVLRARIDDYVTEASAAIESGGFFDFLKITPPDEKYVGRPLIFQLEVADVGIVDADEEHTYEPKRTEFGTRLSFDVSVSQPTPTPGPTPGPGPSPGPTPPPMPMIFAQGFALDTEGNPAPVGSVLRGRIDDYTTESSATIEDEGYFDFIKITPPEERYVGQTLTFHLDVPEVGVVQGEETFTYEPRQTEFGTRLSFDISVTQPTPTPEPEPQPTPEPGPQPTPGPQKGLLARIIDFILRLFGIRR